MALIQQMNKCLSVSQVSGSCSWIFTCVCDHTVLESDTAVPIHQSVITGHGRGHRDSLARIVRQRRNQDCFREQGRAECREGPVGCRHLVRLLASLPRSPWVFGNSDILVPPRKPPPPRLALSSRRRCPCCSAQARSAAPFLASSPCSWLLLPCPRRGLCIASLPFLPPPLSAEKASAQQDPCGAARDIRDAR